MAEVSRKGKYLAGFFMLLAFAGANAFADSTSQPVVTKVLIEDGSYREIANTGTLNAVNRIFYSQSMPSSLKAQPVTEILIGGINAGRLVSTALVEGDWFFALDSSTGDLIAVQYLSTAFSIPNGTMEFSRISIPPG